MDSVKLKELTRLATLSLPGNTRLIVHDPLSGKDRAVLYGELMAEAWKDLSYNAGQSYMTGEFAKAGDSYFESLIDNNLGIAPQPGAEWAEVPLAVPFRAWAQGLHIGEEVYVIGLLPNGLSYAWYRLTETTPYKTTDFAAERDAGKWVLAQDSSGGGGGGGGYSSPAELVTALQNYTGGAWLDYSAIVNPIDISGKLDIDKFYKVQSLADNAESIDVADAYQLKFKVSYTESKTLTVTSVTNLEGFVARIINTNANVLTFAGITLYFNDDELPDGVSFDSNALTFGADLAVPYNIVGEKIDGVFDCKIEIK